MITYLFFNYIGINSQMFTLVTNMTCVFDVPLSHVAISD